MCVEGHRYQLASRPFRAEASTKKPLAFNVEHPGCRTPSGFFLLAYRAMSVPMSGDVDYFRRIRPRQTVAIYRLARFVGASSARDLS